MNRRFLAAALAVAAAFPGSRASAEQPLRVIVGFPAGAAIDVVSRIVAERMREGLKRPVVIDNRPGAGGRLAAELLKNAAPDGHTVMITPIVIPVLAPMVYQKLGYNARTDFVPIGKVCDYGYALAVPANSPAGNLKEYAAWIQSNPQRANFGSPAAGSLPHFFGVMIGSSMGVEMVHVPFNGGAALQSAVLGGHVPAGIDVVMEWQQNLGARKVKVLATSGAERSKVMPEVPTFREQGFVDAVGTGWFAMYAPARTSAAAVAEINAALNRALATQDVRERFAALGLEPAAGTPADLLKAMDEGDRLWGPIVRKSGFRPD